MLMDISSGTEIQGLGERELMMCPRIGEWREIDIDGKAIMHRVEMVAQGNGGIDVFVKRLGETMEVYKKHGFIRNYNVNVW